MNTANLQLEGLYAALSAVLHLLREKGLLTEEEIDRALAAAEANIHGENNGTELSHANLEAARFPIRFLRLANSRPPADEGFLALARQIGRQNRSDKAVE